MAKKPYRQMTQQERRELDAFYGGVCTTLSAMGYLSDGTDTFYLAVVGQNAADELLNFARRNTDIELPKIRRAIAYLKRRGEL